MNECNHEFIDHCFAEGSGLEKFGSIKICKSCGIPEEVIIWQTENAIRKHQYEIAVHMIEDGNIVRDSLQRQVEKMRAALARSRKAFVNLINLKLLPSTEYEKETHELVEMCDKAICDANTEEL